MRWLRPAEQSSVAKASIQMSRVVEAEPGALSSWDGGTRDSGTGRCAEGSVGCAVLPPFV